ncbi:MAG: hypothetical protein H3C34_16700 [Caldilineaceae bacterium]|nr:hypothetical protein [Caldilineaceae bacterium]
MQCRRTASAAALLIAALFMAGCSALRPAPAWQTMYEEKLGQPITALNEKVLNSPFQDDNGNLTRAGWAHMADGSLTLLGLPAYGNPPATVVARTIVLTQPEWQRSCSEAMGGEITGWAWSVVEGSVGNRFVVYGTQESLGSGENTIIPDPDADYCEFVYLPNGWELHLVRNLGVVKSELP